MTEPIVPPSHRCSTCGAEKPLTDEFWHKDKTKRTGFSGTCKACACLRTAKWKDQNKERASQNDKRYYEEHSEAIKARSRQWVEENRQRNIDNCSKWHAEHMQEVRAYRAANAEHISDTKRNWRKTHPDLVKKHKSASQKRHRASANARNRRYGHNHPNQVKVNTQKRHARKRSLPDTFTAEDWSNCLAYFHDCCAVCGRPQGLWHTLAMDHWIPLSDPDCPGTIATNIVPLCHGDGGCNNSKSNRDPREWLVDKFGARRAAVILRAIEIYFASVSS